MVRDFHRYGKHRGALVLERLPPNFEHNIACVLLGFDSLGSRPKNR